MKKKILLIFVIVAVVFIAIELIFIKDKNNSTNNGGSQEQVRINDQGEYVISNASYLVGQDIPEGTYTVSSIISGTDVQVVLADGGSRNLSGLVVGDSVELGPNDAAIIASNGEVMLKPN